MGPPGVLVENQTRKNTAEPHCQIRALPQPEDRSPLGRDRAGREVGGLFREARAMPLAVAAPPVPCEQRRTAFTASRVGARRSRAPWRPRTRLQRRTPRTVPEDGRKCPGLR